NDNPFIFCDYLEDFNVAEDSEYFASSTFDQHDSQTLGVLFDKKRQCIVAYANGRANGNFNDSHIYTVYRQTKYIGERAFNGATNLHYLDFTYAKELDSIGAYSFAATGLKELQLPSTVKKLGRGAFGGNESLKSADLSETSIEVIPKGAFYAPHYFGVHSTLHTVVLPKTVKEIDDEAFFDCDSLRNINIGENLLKIGGLAFCNCDLLDVYIPQNVSEIGASAFDGNKNLRSFNVNGNNEYFASLEKLLFNKELTNLLGIPCALTEITIPESVDSIKCSIASNTTRLKSINVQAIEPPVVGNNWFVDFDATIINVPKGLAQTYRNHEYWGKFKNINESLLPPVDNIQFAGVEGKVGDYVTLLARIIPNEANEAKVNWTSLNSNVATVDANGVVSFCKEGSTCITASCGKKEFVVPVEVKSVEAGNMHLFPVEAQGNPGEAVYMLALLEPDNVTDKSIVWESSDESVAYVDEDGCVSLVGPGTAEITASHGDLVRTCTINVGSSVDLSTVGADGIEMEFLTGGVILKNLPNLAKVIVTDMGGRIVTAVVAQNPTMNISLKAGIYLIHMDDVVAKALIK
ncbi:MAG: leucine-rich repeat protein, partial [Muribaculaceae bacterium]|nr:leucine-rich repeat protein [Muribaculaceae bacterium]